MIFTIFIYKKISNKKKFTMVNTGTIRKGSKVYFADTRGEPVTVSDNLNGKISVRLSKIITTHADELFPVPLTPTLIIRSGFIKTDQFMFEHPEEHIELDYDYKGVTHIHFHKDKKVIAITALHELQYEFWAKTNKELIFV